ncbi:unnamed protein product [Paramecium primaurelia]|uniref:EGF-like domain-containing protein n=1 Tax=Paramecium primaurelia TaxID=5886 RepID=A0A8S1NYL6_PARPR|nr:unnamed protein product [Paramecium primaurelia]
MCKNNFQLSYMFQQLDLYIMLTWIYFRWKQLYSMFLFYNKLFSLQKQFKLFRMYSSTCSSCDDPNCINCNQSSSKCTACASGTYLNGNQCYTCSIINKCVACSNSQKCIACQPGTYLKNDQCQTCDDQNCTYCNSSSICQSCIAGYYLNNNNGCSQCPIGCTSCQNNIQCNSCGIGYYLDGNTCTNCTNSLTKCLACINDSTCTNCEIGNYLDGNSCTKCPISLNSCNACKSNTICIACNSGSYLNGSQCSNCNDINCLNCTDANTCTSCAPTYIVINNACTKCIGYSDKCTSCFNGYCNSCINNYLIQSDGTCLKCPDNCSQGCAKNTLQNTNPTICQVCQDQYYLNSNGLCIKCSSTFLRCKYDVDTQQVYPTQCIDGYFLVNNQCIKAQDENTCQKLYQSNDGNQIDSQLCQDCWPSYQQNNQICYKCPYCADNSCSLDQNNKPICSLCVNYYYSDSNSICQLCVANCIQCNAAGIENCQQCDIGYYKSSNACIACTTDNNNKSTCLNCTNENTCATCQNGYYESNGQCLACQYGCNQCVSPGNTCIACITGFYLQNGGCVKDLGNCLEKQQNQNNGCQVCAYGFYPTKGWLSQSGQSQVIDTTCLQCVYPQAAFVCRANPSDNQVVSASYGSISSIKNTNYYKSATSLGPIRYTTPQCKLGSFWTQQSCMPCPTINNGMCLTCNNFTTCTQIQCNVQYQLITINNNQQCAQIPLGCTEIQYSDQMMSLACTKCNSGYTLIGNICISINGCLNIDQNNGACTQCTNGYYFNWDFLLQNPKTSLSTNTYYYQNFNPFCSKCNTGCAICPSQYTCTECLPGYFWYQSTLTINSYTFKTYTNAQTNASGQCVPCPKNCSTCSSSTICTACNTNFTIDPNSTNGDCICSSPYTYNQTQQTCILIPSVNSTCSFVGCIQCNSDNTQCQTCSPQYALTSPTTCTQCLNCNQCSLQTGTSNPTCLECADGYYKVQANDGAPITCQLCSQSLNNSLRCQGILENQTQLTIIQCADNYFLFGNACYQVGNSNCYTIANPNSQSCQQCLPGYTLYGNNCDQCNTKILNCLTCIQSQDQNGLICQSCINGYVLNTNTNSCQQCPNGCQKCTITGTITPYILSCNTCADGNYIDSNGNCQGCPFDCKSCDSKYICNTCNDGYYLVQSSVILNSKPYIFKPCYPCQNNCATCTGPTGNICQTCKTGFVLQNGGCIDLTLKILNDSTSYNLANCYTSDSTGCTVCLAGFFLDSQRVCQECVSPYNNFVCGLKAVSPTSPSNPSSNQTNTNTNTNTTTDSIQIGYNPTQPSSLSLILATMLIFMVQ